MKHSVDLRQTDASFCTMCSLPSCFCILVGWQLPAPLLLQVPLGAESMRQLSYFCAVCSLSADLPRSISDLNLAEHAASMHQGQP